MRHRNLRGVGICLGASGAVIALVHAKPTRLAAIADVTWPNGLSLISGARTESPPVAAAHRLLRRARRRLGLPRACPVSVVIGPSLWEIVPSDVLAGGAGLLSRAGLAPSSVTAAERAASLRLQVTVGTGAIGAAAVTQEASLAIGAALASLGAPLDSAAVQAMGSTMVHIPAPLPAPAVDLDAAYEPDAAYAPEATYEPDAAYDVTLNQTPQPCAVASGISSVPSYSVPSYSVPSCTVSAPPVAGQVEHSPQPAMTSHRE